MPPIIMQRSGSMYVRFTHRLGGIPLMLLCLVVMLAQGGFIDYFLIRHHKVTSYAWLTFDAVNLVVFVLSFITTRRRIPLRAKHKICPFLSLGWLAWLLYAASLITRWAVIFVHFSWELKDEELLGPNALKVTLAVSSGVFFLLLVTNHNSKRSIQNIPYIEELTGSVVFDVVDTVDILDVLFDAEAREIFPLSLELAIVGMSGINIMIPTIPLLILSFYDFGRKKLPRRLVVLHKLLLAFAVNLPYFVLRMIMWLKYRVAISAFCVKNIVVIVVVLYGFFMHKNEKVITRETACFKAMTENGGSATNAAATVVEIADEGELEMKPREMSAGDAVVEENTCL